MAKGTCREVICLSLGVSENDVKTFTDFITMISSLNINSILKGLVILLIGLIAVRFIVKAFYKTLSRAKNIPATVHNVLKTFLRVVLNIVVILIALTAMGIPISSFVTVLSVVVLAVTLAIQNILNNIVGGFIIMSSHPFHVGDFVQMDDIIGTVDEIRIMYTRFLAPDGRTIYIPNKTIYTANLINYTQFGRRRAEVTVSASYNSPPEAVRTAVTEALRQTPGVLQDPAPIIHLESYGDSAIAYSVYFWCNTGDFWNVKYDFNERLYAAFKNNGVEMTYPHLNVHMDA